MISELVIRTGNAYTIFVPDEMLSLSHLNRCKYLHTVIFVAVWNIQYIYIKVLLHFDIVPMSVYRGPIMNTRTYSVRATSCNATAILVNFKARWFLRLTWLRMRLSLCLNCIILLPAQYVCAICLINVDVIQPKDSEIYGREPFWALSASISWQVITEVKLLISE